MEQTKKSKTTRKRLNLPHREPLVKQQDAVPPKEKPQKWEDNDQDEKNAKIKDAIAYLLHRYNEAEEAIKDHTRLLNQLTQKLADLENKF